MNIYLLGYMGSGKSTVGQQVALLLKMKFIDFDRYLEAGEGKTITQIFDGEGEERFRKLEHDYLKKVINEKNALVSLGGGTPCFFNNMEIINASGTSIYLELDVDSLVKRLSNARNKRPLIRDLNETELKYFIETNLEKRKPIYTQAHIHVNGSARKPEEISEEIATKIGALPKR